MERRQRPALAAQVGAHLDETAGIRAGIGACLGGENIGRLAGAELAGRLRLHEVVDPGTATAKLLLGRLEHLETRHGAEHRARGIAHSLRVEEMARILERKPKR